MRNYFNRMNINHTMLVKNRKYTKNLAHLKRISRRHTRRALNAKTLMESKFAMIERIHDIDNPYFV